MLPEVSQRRRLNPEYISDRVSTNRQRAIIEESLLPNRFNLRRRVEREPDARAVQHSDMDNGDLIARSRAIIGSDAPVDLDAIVELKMKVFEQIGFGHALGVARKVPDDYECGLGEDAKPVDPASKKNFPINELTEGVNQGALVERGFHSRKSFILRIFAGTTKLTAAVPSSFRQGGS